MKICFLADYQSIHTYKWLKYFVPKNEVHLISLELPGEEAGLTTPEKYAELGIKVHILPRKGIDKLRAPSRVRKMLREIRPDVVHAHYITHYGYLAASSVFHPLVMTAWGTDVLIDAHSSFMKKHQVRKALRAADVVTCDGENTTKALSELMGGRDRIKKIYFGVDTRKNTSERRVEGFFDKYLKGGKGKTVINIRGFNPVYDPDTFMKAIPPVLEKYPDTVFIMAREGERRKVYEEMAGSMGIVDSVKFIGNISADELPTYLSSADVYVSTSISDSGISASTAEAMAGGTAVVSTDVGDASYWIEDGKNGMIVPKGDYKALSEKILYLISNDGMRESMGREARITIETRQDYYKEMAKVESLYESLIRKA